MELGRRKFIRLFAEVALGTAFVGGLGINATTAAPTSEERGDLEAERKLLSIGVNSSGLGRDKTNPLTHSLRQVNSRIKAIDQHNSSPTRDTADLVAKAAGATLVVDGIARIASFDSQSEQIVSTELPIATEVNLTPVNQQ
ncbi:MAG TPA: hypothetical protein VG965_04660 [Patescibacteria group bacterium]|nr:hypothetical protein [Patescibacteria group bacterium]